MEYTDSSGVDLQAFIIQTLHKNQKDRMMLLKIEHELVSLVKDNKWGLPLLHTSAGIAVFLACQKYTSSFLGYTV